nr:MAG TPA: hypothetical protein [Caudoviricetes sp.]
MLADPPDLIRRMMARESRRKSESARWHFHPYEVPPTCTLLQLEVRAAGEPDDFGPTLWRGCGVWDGSEFNFFGIDVPVDPGLTVIFRRWYA